MTNKSLAICMTLVLAAWATFETSPPKPKIVTILNPDGTPGYVRLDCPEGWTGYAEWHTYITKTPQEQLKQYAKDATKGVCKKSDKPQPYGPAKNI